MRILRIRIRIPNAGSYGVFNSVLVVEGSGPLMMDVHMHRPTTNSKHFADALGAFWPGLQVPCFKVKIPMIVEDRKQLLPV